MLARLVVKGLKDLALHPFANLFAFVTVAMVSLLAGLFLMFLSNINQELLRHQGQVEFQIFWKTGADEALIREQWDRLAAMKDLRDMETFDPERALSELAGSLAGAGDFSWLDEHNPLPHTAYVSFTLPEDDNSKIWAMGLLGELRALPGVDKVHYNPLQMDLAQSWMAISRAVLWPIIGFLGLVVALVVGNTVKLSLMTRRDEVEILSLVGAKPWYVRIPLLVGGAALGLVGSGAALGALRLLHMQVEQALNFPPLLITIDFLPWPHCALLSATVALVATVSSWVAVRK